MNSAVDNTFLRNIETILNRMSVELQARSVLFLRRDGQILARSGKLSEAKIPQMAALIAAMAAASESVAEISENSKEESRLSLEFPASGLYAVAVSTEFWVAVLYENTLNPGLLRMRTRQFGSQIERMEKKWNESGITLTPLHGQKSPLFENITDEEIDSLFGASS